MITTFYCKDTSEPSALETFLNNEPSVIVLLQNRIEPVAEIALDIFFNVIDQKMLDPV